MPCYDVTKIDQCCICMENSAPFVFDCCSISYCLECSKHIIYTEICAQCRKKISFNDLRFIVVLK